VVQNQIDAWPRHEHRQPPQELDGVEHQVLGPVAGGALVLWILSTATPAEFALTAIVLASAALAYVIRKRTRSSLL
jgi:hypothetical protein